MSTTATKDLPPSDSERNAEIKQVITAAGNALRARHRWLRHQDSIGAAVLLLALGGMGASAYAYLQWGWSAWLVIPLIAFFASLTHELEHDLIHWMYFKRRPWAHHLMLALCWLARPSTINPWVRRELHFEHHKYSGGEQDREERGITNGERWGLARLLMLADAGFSVWYRIRRVSDPATRRRLWKRALAIYFPLGWINWGLWYVFLFCHGLSALAALIGAPHQWPPAMLQPLALLDILIVVWIGPNVLRSFCLHFVSSNMHYHGDVTPGDVIQQTQVLNPWWLLPFQAFCFNFGSTHAIHHFVVKEPFYIRQWTAPTAHRVMREMGVRFNDFGTFVRANRWSDPKRSAQSAA
ncbi:MAG: fatty acid desaturase [Xanthomonadales bacterium]|nr:fatty acid desaturase [Xanthomonadales bacterium]